LGATEFRENPKCYNIPHYGMFMLSIARYGKLGLIPHKSNAPRFASLCDSCDPGYHRLFLITFDKLYDGPILPAGQHTYFYYVVKDEPQGEWRAFEGGTGP